MKSQNKNSDTLLVFSRWTRKNYAIFASLHKSINIARLSVSICKYSFSKNQSLLRLANRGLGIDTTENDFEEKDILFSDWATILGLVTADTYHKKNKPRNTVHVIY